MPTVNPDGSGTGTALTAGANETLVDEITSRLQWVYLFVSAQETFLLQVQIPAAGGWYPVREIASGAMTATNGVAGFDQGAALAEALPQRARVVIENSGGNMADGYVFNVQRF